MKTYFLRRLAEQLCITLFLGMIFTLIALLPGSAVMAGDVAALLAAYEKNDVAAAGKILDQDDDVETVVNVDGMTLLMLAAKDGKREFVDLLLARGAALEARDNRGMTPLLIAADQGHTEIVSLLLDKGAAIEAKSDRGFTPLMEAACSNMLEAVSLLLSRGADVHAKSSIGDTALSRAAREEDSEISRVLLAAGEDEGSHLHISFKS